MKKSRNIIVIALLVTTIFFSWQWNQSRLTVKGYGENFNALLFNSLESTRFHLQKAADIMTIYDEDFSEREKALFRESMDQSARDINIIGSNLNWIVSEFNWRRYFHEENLFTIEKVLGDISRGNITDPLIIQSVSQVLSNASQDIHDLIYIEQIGVAGLSDPDIQTRIVETLRTAKEELNRIIQ
jgi:hypothetical protein